MIQTIPKLVTFDEFVAWYPEKPAPDLRCQIGFLGVRLHRNYSRFQLGATRHCRDTASEELGAGDKTYPRRVPTTNGIFAKSLMIQM